MKVSHSQKKSTGHGTGVIQERVLGRRGDSASGRRGNGGSRTTAGEPSPRRAAPPTSRTHRLVTCRAPTSRP